MIYPGRRTSDYTDSSQIRRAFAIVNALLGNWDKPGGLTAARVVGLKEPGIEAPFYDDNPEDRVDAGVAPMMFEEEGAFKVFRDAVLAGKPYPVKGFFTYKTNPMATAANRAKTRAMYEALDFAVAADIVMSDTAFMSDLVLPSQHAFERQDPCSAQQGSSACACVVMRDPVVDQPFAESKPVFWMLQELAKRMDLGEYFDLTIDQYRQEQTAGLPGALAALKNDGVYYNPSKLYGVYEGRIFKTKSHKIELYNQAYQDLGLDPLPVYHPVKDPAENQFRLVVGRTATITQSSSQNNRLLTEFHDENDLWIHPEPAGRLRLRDGMTAWVRSPVGRQAIRVRVTRRVRPDVVYMHTGYGPLSPNLGQVSGRGASIAELLDDPMDALTGNMAMHETMVTVSLGEQA
jgi:thiosulfate reductase/polysulfide reductase chain A